MTTDTTKTRQEPVAGEWRVERQDDLGAVFVSGRREYIAKTYYSAAKALVDAHNASLAAPVAQQSEATRDITHDTGFMDALDAYMDAVTDEERNSDNRIAARKRICAAAEAWARGQQSEAGAPVPRYALKSGDTREWLVPDTNGPWCRWDHVAPYVAGAPTAAAFQPTEQQYLDWCERHDLESHLNRDAFDDAATLYLTATTSGRESAAPVAQQDAPCKYDIYPAGTSPRTCARCGKGPCRKGDAAMQKGVQHG